LEYFHGLSWFAILVGDTPVDDRALCRSGAEPGTGFHRRGRGWVLDRIEIELRDFGKSPQDAIVDAALGRLRPILLTTATTSVGLVPLWLGGGLLWEPMAIGIIFGLLFATLLTLVFVPVLYRLFFRVSFQK
jgi:hypothetical protein